MKCHIGIYVAVITLACVLYVHITADSSPTQPSEKTVISAKSTKPLHLAWIEASCQQIFNHVCYESQCWYLLEFFFFSFFLLRTICLFGCIHYCTISCSKPIFLHCCMSHIHVRKCPIMHHKCAQSAAAKRTAFAETTLNWSRLWHASENLGKWDEK